MAHRIYKFRLQGIPDLDLINLVKNYNIKARPFFKSCLINYVQNKHFLYDMPECIKNVELNTVVIQLHFDENDEIESRIIKFLDSLKNSCRNNLIKNIARSYIKMPMPLIVSDSGDIKVSEHAKSPNSPLKPQRVRKTQDDLSKQDKFEKNTGISTLKPTKIKTNEENSSKVIGEDNKVLDEKDANSIRIEIEEANSIRIEEPITENNKEDLDPLAMMEDLCMG